MFRLLLLLCAISVVVLSAPPPAPIGSSPTSSAPAGPAPIGCDEGVCLQAFARHFHDKNADAIVALFDTNAEFTLNGKKSIKGKGIQYFFKDIFGLKPRDLTMMLNEIHHDGDVTTVSGTFEVETTKGMLAGQFHNVWKNNKIQSGLIVSNFPYLKHGFKCIDC